MHRTRPRAHRTLSTSPARSTPRRNPLSVLYALTAATLLAGVLLAPATPHHSRSAPAAAPAGAQQPPASPPAAATAPTPAPARPARRTVPHPPPPAPAKGSGSHLATVAYAASTPSSARAYARARLSTTQYSCMNQIFIRESGWNPRAYNPSSGAFGIPQALPASKLRSAGADWRTNGATQVKWGLTYMKSRYGSPCGAWSFWKRHHWY